MIDGLICAADAGECIAWIKNGDALYSAASRQKFATLKNCETGVPLGLTLADLNHDPNVVVKFKALAERELSQAAA